MADGVLVGTPSNEHPIRDAAHAKIGKHREGDVFEYEFDFGDSWQHLCTVQKVGVDPQDVYGVRPGGPVAIWGWGIIPDQYGRATPHR